jgi:hypothetical protein
MSRLTVISLVVAVFVGLAAVGCSEDPAQPVEDDDGSTPPLEKWGAVFGDQLNDLGRSVAVDPASAVFVTGAFEDSVDFGGGPRVSAGSQDIFLAKFGQSGKHLWSRGYGDAGFQQGASVAADPSGNVVMTGVFEGTVNFGGGPLTSSGFRDLFVVKFDADATHLWSRSFGGSSFEREGDIAVDRSGNVAVTGSFPGTVDFGGGPLTSDGNYDAFLVKFGPGGSHLWSQRFGGTDSDAGTGVAFDRTGNILLTGQFHFTADFGGGPLTSAGAADVFIAKFDASGNHVWSKAFGDLDLQEAAAIEVDGADSVVVTGNFGGTVDFGGGPLTTAGSTDVFLVKLDESGNHVWSDRFGDTDLDNGVGVVAGLLGECVVTGSFRGSVDFGGGALSSVGSGDIFVAKFDMAGNHLWSMAFGNSSGDSGNGVCLNSAGNVFMTGYFNGSVNFDGTTLNGAGGTDIFVFKVRPTGLPLNWFF